jgi:DNA-binding CsgD family transcriptional regulator
LGGGVTERLERIIGREAEVSALRQFVAAEPTAGTVVLAGVPGIGKTTLWQEGIDSARDRGLRVLVSRPSGAEAQHSFAGLIDLCDGLEEHALAVLPAPQRAALEVALLRSEPGGQPPGAQAIALGFLGVLRVLSANAPLLVAVDDLQWLDGPSNDLLAFAARRLEREPVAFLLAKRPLAPSQLERALERRSVHRLDVGPLSFGATRRLLAARLKLSLSRDLLRRVVDVTLGNPLFVIELGRAFIEQGIPEGRDDIPLPGGIEDLLGMRIAALAPDVRRLLVAVALSADLRAAEAVAVAGVQALERAIDAGVIDVVGDRVRPSHPLVTAAAKSAAPRGEQRELHLALAGAVADDELRAMHLAFATEHTDGELADTVERAARAAFARGARQQAVQLAEHALRLTPPRSPARPERLLVLARYLEVAGEIQRVTDLLTPHLASLPSGAPRARAWLMLSEGAGPRHLDDLRRYRERALAECDNDPLLRALVLAKNASNAAGSTITGLERAGESAREAFELARGEGGETEQFTRYALAWTRAMTGLSVDDLCRAGELVSYIAGSPERVAAQRLIWRGEVDGARSLLTRFLAQADEQGERESYALQRLHLCELHLRVGEWDAAAALLEEWGDSSDRGLMFRPKYERCRALLHAGRGDAAEAESWARRTIALAEETGSLWDGLEAARALGMSALLSHQPGTACEALREVWAHTQREGVDEPGVFPVAPELVEALVESGELEEAAGVASRLRELAERQAHPWGLVTARRCESLAQLAAASYDERAAESLDASAAAYGELGLRFDQARSLLSLGRAQRRFKKWGVARRSLQHSASIFDALGSPGWSEQARSELSRVGARRPVASGELTESEQRAAELAASGMSNKQIARELFVTVHTVEVHLSRAYAKLGVSSRRQLSARLQPID